jgi:hypothetical protein
MFIATLEILGRKRKKHIEKKTTKQPNKSGGVP